MKALRPPGNGRPAGALVLVATPIGNLGDLSPRSVQALADADVIGCEDTRRTRQLLAHAGIPAGHRLVTVNDHTEAGLVGALLARLDAGERVALVTDAGMPAVSDPGERVVAAAAAAGYPVEVVPGPSAALAALVVSGLPSGRFCFEGFLPRKGKARAERLADVVAERRTTVLFEAPHRLRRTMADLAAKLDPLRPVVIARELTKVFEEVWRGTVAGAGEHLAVTEPRGEYVVVLGGAAPEPRADAADVDDALRVRLHAGIDKRTAVTEVAAELGVPKREVYEAAISLAASPPRAGPQRTGERAAAERRRDQPARPPT